MKPAYLYGVVIILLVVGIGVVGWQLMSDRSPSPTDGTQPPYTLPEPGAAVTRQGAQTETDPRVAADFRRQQQNPDQFTLEGTVIVSPYVLQTWIGTHTGGEALLKYAASTGWVIIDMGGGAWDVAGLMEAGVPEEIAKELIRKSPPL